MKKQPNDLHNKKVIKKRSLKAVHKVAKHKKKNKAELSREFFLNCAKAIAHIEAFNIVRAKEEKIDHLRKAINLLEKCLDQRPANHLIKSQYDICREELCFFEGTDETFSKEQIELLLSTEMF